MVGTKTSSLIALQEADDAYEAQVRTGSGDRQPRLMAAANLRMVLRTTLPQLAASPEGKALILSVQEVIATSDAAFRIGSEDKMMLEAAKLHPVAREVRALLERLQSAAG